MQFRCSHEIYSIHQAIFHLTFPERSDVMKRLTMGSRLVILLFFAVAGVMRAQVTESWASRYAGPGTGTDQPNAVAVDAGGNVHVTGSSQSGGFASEDFATIKYGPDGDTLWVKRFNGTGGGSDFANAIALDADGDVYVTGQSWGLTSAYDYLTIKYNADGDTVWTRRYNGSRNGGDIPHSIAVDGTGNVYVTGESEGLVGTHGIYEDYVTIKYTLAGDEAWAARYNGLAGDYDRANAIAVDNLGNVYVTGVSDGGSSGSGAPFFDYATLKYDSAGTFEWVMTYNGPGSDDDEATSIAVDDSGHVYVTGKTQDDLSDLDYTTIRYSTSGVVEWLAVYDGPASNADEATDLVVDGIGNAYVTGKSYGGASMDFDYATIKYNALGDTVWVRRYNGPASDDDGASEIALDMSGNVYVAGYSSGMSTGFDFATLKYDAVGDQQWEIRYTNLGSAGSSDVPNGLAVDSVANVYVAGMSALDYATVKYTQSTTSVETGGNGVPDGFSLFQNYPNPFNPTTTIQFEVGHLSLVILKVYDLLGREVATLVNESKESGRHVVPFDASGLASGVYVYKLEAGGFVEAKRLVLLK